MNGKHLIVLGCSATKVDVEGSLPAITLYDGPTFRVLRSFLREYHWPKPLSIAVLSAKYGMIGGVSQIETYDQRMTSKRADELGNSVMETLVDWSSHHDRVDFVMGQDYVRSIDRARIASHYPQSDIVEGSIGIKLNRLHNMLRTIDNVSRNNKRDIPRLSRPLYFLPDWDDFIDEGYDFVNDQFSVEKRSERNEKHIMTLMHPKRLCDGVLVSLAQHLGSKGFMKRKNFTDPASLAPGSVRDYFSLASDQWAFGDCGAFSYVNEYEPTISIEQAIALYDLYEFDFGASVDHIPVKLIFTENGKQPLSDDIRKSRVEITRNNADKFIRLHKEQGKKFIPMGVIQGLGPESFANQIGAYLDMGYRHLALGGLVPCTNNEIREIVTAVNKELKRHSCKPWIHLFGIFRPELQPLFREVGIGSFDSATYFRKAWLRSDQNYLGSDGQWYAAIRVPPLRDPRIKTRLAEQGKSQSELEILEQNALNQLMLYSENKVEMEVALAAVIEYDSLLSRGESLDKKLIAAYRTTLQVRPWERCNCPMCRKLGINIMIFRGKNRNKSRGAHNTLQLFETVNHYK